MEWFKRFAVFLRETRAEMGKVSFPGREEVVGTTIVAIVTSVIFAAYLWAADQVIIWVFQGINRVFG